MLLIHHLIFTAGILLFFTSLVSTLPIDSNDVTDSSIDFANKQKPAPNSLLDATDIDDAEFFVDLNRFTHLLSAHIMAEHLESAVIALSKSLAAQIQSSVQLTSQSSTNHGNSYHQEQQQLQRDYDDEGNNDSGDVDIRLLKEQIQGAVGSYVEDQLPNMWYSHSSFAALDSMSLRSFMETSLLEYCPSTTLSDDDDAQNDNDDVVIRHDCLEAHSTSFSAIVDVYVKKNMHSTLVDIVQQDLPQLLVMTDNHIRAVLNHFNSFLLPPHCQLRMTLLSLQDHQAWSGVDNINAILDSITEGENNYLRDGTLIHSIHQYASLSKTSSSP
jgi:hypothetical protein